MDNYVSISADLHLAKTLDALKMKEDGERRLAVENQGLKAELHQAKNTSELLMDENKQLKSAQQQLCGEMDELKHTNEDLKKENLQLHGKLREQKQQQQQQNGRDASGGTPMGEGHGSRCQRCAEIDRELSKLKSVNNELRYINDQWDKDYREHEEVFRRFRNDSRRAQSENESFIATLKEGKEQLLEQIRDLQYELDRSRKEVHRIQQQQQVSGYQNGISPRRLKDLEEENAFLRTQLKTYQEDFEAERRDRERLNEEKQSAALRFEAEITSLKLQLDRCRNELVHYTTESTRLAQQLRLKNQYEEDQFKKHLESQGYIPRSPNSALPPLDPYVENDPPPSHRRHLAPPTNGSATSGSTSNDVVGQSRRLVPGQFLARSAEDVSRSAPNTTEHRHLTPPAVQRNSHPPSPTYKNIHDHQHNHQSQLLPAGVGQIPNGYIMQNGHVATTQAVKQFQQLPRSQPSPSPSPQALVNGGIAPSTPYTTNGYANGGQTSNVPQLVNRDSMSRINGFQYPPNFQQLVVGGSTGVSGNAHHNQQPVISVPRVESKGKYACPRCARRFVSKTDCTDHKARCMS